MISDDECIVFDFLRKISYWIIEFFLFDFVWYKWWFIKCFINDNNVVFVIYSNKFIVLVYVIVL